MHIPLEDRPVLSMVVTITLLAAAGALLVTIGQVVMIWLLLVSPEVGTTVIFWTSVFWPVVAAVALSIGIVRPLWLSMTRRFRPRR